MNWDGAFRDHVAAVRNFTAEALEHAARAGAHYEGIVFHSGSPGFYHADDIAIPFRPVPHFTRLAPLEGPGHLLCLRPGRALRLVRFVPTDYWYEVPPAPALPEDGSFDLSEAATLEQAARAIGDVTRCAYVGNDPAVAEALGIAPDAREPHALLAPLDWYRAFKTPYEVECIRVAARIAGRGHAAAREAVEAQASERDIHLAYLAATGLLENETPYPNIVAWDNGSAVLHYSSKRSTPPDPGDVFLIDAGASFRGYASDITRSYAQAGAHPVFREALERMELLQRTLVAEVAPGRSFVALHEQAERGVCQILSDLAVLEVSAEEAWDRGLAGTFLPHGLGHHLGLQVHDVAGQQVSPNGEQRPPPEAQPHLRTTRDLESGHVVTIEPGLYFIPMLLAALRASDRADALNWRLVDALALCGGIRVEDDVHVTADARDDLSRPFVPGSRLV